MNIEHNHPSLTYISVNRFGRQGDAFALLTGTHLGFGVATAPLAVRGRLYADQEASSNEPSWWLPELTMCDLPALITVFHVLPYMKTTHGVDSLITKLSWLAAPSV